MTIISTLNLLYLQTAISAETETLVQYKDYHIKVPFTPLKMIHYLLELNHTSLQVQTSLSKRILNINKLIPIYINKDNILFPLTKKRASIKYFINARNIIGIHSSVDSTQIVFNNATILQVNMPYTLVSKKWQESLHLAESVEKTTFY